MTLQELRTYHKLREYQISHLINARKCQRYGKCGEQQLFMYLLFWADAMYEADKFMLRAINSHVVSQSRGAA